MAAVLPALSPPTPSSAATIRFEGVDGLTDGSRHVGPFRVTVDGIGYDVLCYDLAHSVGFGQVWQANLLTYDQLGLAYFTGQTGYFGKYQMAGWLFTQLLQAASPAARIGIQHAAWSLFSSQADYADAAPWLAAAAAARAEGFPSVDFSTLRIINSPAGQTPVQGFIAGGFEPVVPEPPAITLVGAGILLIGFRWLQARRL